MSEDRPSKPLPQINAVTRPFWSAAAERRLCMPRCRECAAFTISASAKLLRVRRREFGMDEFERPRPGLFIHGDPADCRRPGGKSLPT